jgi:hypothetical protein
LLASISTTLAIITGPIASDTVPEIICPACCAKEVEEKARKERPTPTLPKGGSILDSIFIINYSLFIINY